MAREKMAGYHFELTPSHNNSYKYYDKCVYLYLSFRVPPAKEMKPFWMMTMSMKFLLVTDLVFSVLCDVFISNKRHYRSLPVALSIESEVHFQILDSVAMIF